MSHQVILMSDIHLCHLDWYGISGSERMEKMISDLNAAYEKEAYEAIFFLGDYSLDHWVYGCGGSYLHQGISNTRNLVETFLSRLTCPVRYMLPGNHEQYGHEQWKQITGCERQFAVYHGGYLFLMLDTFSANLEPVTDSDGTYTPADIAFIQQKMMEYPNVPVLLCAHFFDLRKETNDFKELVRNEERILCLFCGHDHLNRIEAPRALGGKLIIHDGHYSYSGYHDPSRCPWGWLKITLHEEGIACSYTYPESNMSNDQTITHIHAGEGAAIQLPLTAERPIPLIK